MKVSAPFAAFGIALLLLSSIGPYSGLGKQKGTGQPFPTLYSEASTFSTPIEAAEVAPVLHRMVSGITVPHHLLAADLIARGFRVAEKNQYDKIVILFPDHFKKTRRPFATTHRAFETVFGVVETSEKDVAHLLNDGRIVEESNLFFEEHGLGALLPFVKHYFPETPIVPVAVSLGATRDELERLIADLKPVITRETLILQSTDFSHYLTQAEAILRDQEVLNILAANDVDALVKLRQPAHLDSRGAQYLQMRLQAEHFGARPLVIANMNSQSYADHEVRETTSYIVQIYPSADETGQIEPAGPDMTKTYCFAGDTFFGRYMQKALARPGVTQRLREALTDRLKGCPLIVNLEGVTTDAMPEARGPLTLAMPETLALDWLKTLNVVAVGVANNHAKDLGRDAFAGMVGTLVANDIKVLRHGEISDLGAFRIVALTDIDNNEEPYRNRVGEETLRAIGRSSASPPLVAFLHWGTEYDAAPDMRQTALADALRRRGVSLIVGAHPHRANLTLEVLAGGQALVAYSLGNFIFDQFDDRASSAILEVRFFPQGTFFARLVPIPNVYELSRSPDPGMRKAAQ